MTGHRKAKLYCCIFSHLFLPPFVVTAELRIQQVCRVVRGSLNLTRLIWCENFQSYRSVIIFTQLMQLQTTDRKEFRYPSVYQIACESDQTRSTKG